MVDEIKKEEENTDNKDKAEEVKPETPPDSPNDKGDVDLKATIELIQGTIEKINNRLKDFDSRILEIENFRNTQSVEARIRTINEEFENVNQGLNGLSANKADGADLVKVKDEISAIKKDLESLKKPVATDKTEEKAD